MNKLRSSLQTAKGNGTLTISPQETPFDHLELPRTPEEAKEYACKYSTRWLTADEIQQRIEGYKGDIERAVSMENRAHLETHVSELRGLLDNEQYTDGNFHQSIDELLFELVEWRAMFFAFEHTEVPSTPFDQHVFLQQWAIGGVHTMFSILSKLVDTDSRTRSLIKLWRDLHHFVAKEINDDEIKLLDNHVRKKGGLFSHQISKAIKFRNQVIAHNEKRHSIDVRVLDSDIQVLCRIWSIITTWSSFGVMQPWRDAEQAFSGLDRFFNASEIHLLKARRAEYLSNVEKWCKTNMHTLATDALSPFATFSATITVTPVEGTSTQL